MAGYEIDESLERDIQYSNEVWVHADKEKLMVNLNVTERDLITSKGWLNGSIIDASMSILQCQFPELSGFQPSYFAEKLKFERHSNASKFVQIFNRTPKGGGSHWLTASNINCKNSCVKPYDSAFADIPTREKCIIASLVQIDEDYVVS